LGKTPKATDAKAASTARGINAALIIGALVFTSAIAWYTMRSPEPDTRAPLPTPTTTTLDPAQFSGKTRSAYEAAKEVPGVLAQLPCFCGCMSGFGHKSNLDCFHDNHGVDCAMCQDIAIDARGMYKSGMDIDRIRNNIKEKYGKYATLME
jgi:hypothetical protein